MVPNSDSKNNNKKKLLLILPISGVFLIFCCCIAILLYAVMEGSKPEFKATMAASSLLKTEEILKSYTSTATSTTIPSQTLTPTISFTPTITFTSAVTLTPSATYTNTRTSTLTLTPTNTSTNTPTPTSTSTVPSHSTKASTNTPTLIPPNAGISEWMVYKDRYVGANKIAYDRYLNYYKPQDGYIFVSVYIIYINTPFIGEGTLQLYDGLGNLHPYVPFTWKSPSYHHCYSIPGGDCEGWLSFMILDEFKAKDNLFLSWIPCFFCTELEVLLDTK